MRYEGKITGGEEKLGDKITDDPSDNKFLACALEGEADYIVSRDSHLRSLKQFHGIKIIDAKGFTNEVKRRG